MLYLKLKEQTLVLVLLISIWACNDEKLQPPKSVNGTLSYGQSETNREIFAKTLSSALKDPSVRELLKNEASKEFDGETEVLFQIIQSQQLSSGETLMERLTAIHGSKDEFEAVVKSLPLLTILVPEVYHFSNNTWDVATQIPAVAALKTKNGNTDVSALRTFYADGTARNLQRNVIPTEPVIVVKDSERIVLSGNVKDARSGRTSTGTVFAAGNFQFQFVSENFEHSVSSDPRSSGGRYSYHADNDFCHRAIFAYDNDLQYHRDYVYYGIAPELGINVGTWKEPYAEYITAIRVENVMNLNNIFDDIATDWSDGNLEFAVNVLFVDSKTALGNVNKVFSLHLDDLCDFTQNSNGSITIIRLHPYNFYNAQTNWSNKGIEILPWDMQRYGDTWKFVVQEQDAATSSSYTITSNITSNYGTNYSGNQKDGPNFGSTTATGVSYTQAYQVTIAGQSDVLGEALLHWTDPVVTSMNYDDPDFVEGYTREISTGTIALSVEPLKRWYTPGND